MMRLRRMGVRWAAGCGWSSVDPVVSWSFSLNRSSYISKLYGLVLAAALATGACGSPSQPTPAAPQITCPAPVSATSPDGNPFVVSYTTPVVSGGAVPVTTACSVPSGSTFPVGTTTVGCTATDARQRTASCSFDVTVARPPALTVTRIVAFGDSITFGVSGECNRGLRFGLPLTIAEDLRRLRFAPVLAPGKDYPSVLRDMLAARYTASPPSVINAGVGGEWVTDSVTFDRFRGILNAQNPDALLLLEGINDLNSAGAPAVPEVPAALRDMVREARRRGVRVFLATLLPERDGSCRDDGFPYIPATNDLIRGVAAAEGAVLVDLFAVFSGQLDTLLDEDGLHPTEAGYRKMAETFFSSIRTTLEAPALRRTAR
jgi:lysophospholipase L1-like esterase